MTTTEPAGVADLQLDPAKANHIGIFGRKGTGKSVLARRFFESYPFDRLVIDPTGDLRPSMPPKPELIVLEPPIPARWPMTADDEHRSTVYFKPDFLSPTVKDDIDRAIGMAFVHGRCLAWIDEASVLGTAQQTGPHTTRVLHQSRHVGLSLIFCGPRPVNVDPLVVAQADYIAIFQLPNPNDRRRLADTMGWDPDELDERVGDLEGHEWLWFDARQHQLLGPLPPIPLKRKWPQP